MLCHCPSWPAPEAPLVYIVGSLFRFVDHSASCGLPSGFLDSQFSRSGSISHDMKSSGFRPHISMLVVESEGDANDNDHDNDIGTSSSRHVTPSASSSDRAPSSITVTILAAARHIASALVSHRHQVPSIISSSISSRIRSLRHQHHRTARCTIHKTFISSGRGQPMGVTVGRREAGVASYISLQRDVRWFYNCTRDVLCPRLP